jgi:hypothetical protein
MVEHSTLIQIQERGTLHFTGEKEATHSHIHSIQIMAYGMQRQINAP